MKILYFVLILIVSTNCEFQDGPRNFSVEFLRRTELQTGGQVVVSPFGVWTVMTALATGTDGESYKQLQRALVLTEYNSTNLVKGYKTLTKEVLGHKDKGVTLTNTNIFFVHQKFKIYDSFKKSLEEDFAATLTQLNFDDPNAPILANKAIQNAGATHVKDLLNPEDFSNSLMILTNVISFKGLWKNPFNKTDTKVEPFYNNKREEIGKVNMMYLKAPLHFSSDIDLKGFVLDIPYGDDSKFSMLIMLPFPDVTVNDMYKNLEKVSFDKIFKKIEEASMYSGDDEKEIRIPRFQINTNVVVNKPLTAMGIRDIFDSDLANFSKTTSDHVYVTTVVHKAVIEVTEEGTIAEALSVVDIADRISASSFTANRPFAYVIIEKPTRTVIFSGIYSKPTLY